MAGFSDLFEIVVSCLVEVGGKGVISGGKGVMVAGARKIGWASSGGSSSRTGRRFSGHSLSRRGLSSGFGGGITRTRLGKYDPKGEYSSRGAQFYKMASRSGTGAGGMGAMRRGAPTNLHGRPSFNAPGSPLGRSSGRWSRSSFRSWGYSKNPRGHINF